MFSTICLLFLLGFLLWMNASTRISWPDKGPVLARLASTPAYSRCAATVLFLVAAALCVSALGMGSGLFAAFVILMTAGSVCVLFFPFRYFGSATVAMVYMCAVLIEFLIP